MTVCAECGYTWGGRPQDAVEVVVGFPDRLLEVGLREDGRLRTRPTAGVWSPLEYVAHTGDAIGWYAGRIARVLTEDRPRLRAFDWDAHTAAQKYHQRRLADVLASVRGSCVGLAGKLGALTAPEWERAGVGSDGSPRTVAQLADRAGHEAHHHLGDIAHGLMCNQL